MKCARLKERSMRNYAGNLGITKTKREHLSIYPATKDCENGGEGGIRTPGTLRPSLKHRAMRNDKVLRNQPSRSVLLSPNDKVCYLKLEHFWNVFSIRLSTAFIAHFYGWPGLSQRGGHPQGGVLF